MSVKVVRKRGARPVHHPEQDLQITIVALLRTILPASVLWLHIPNGGARTRAEGGILKAMGQRAGAPDLLFMWTINGLCRVGWVELKAPRGGQNSLVQVGFQMHAKQLGHETAVVRSVEGILAVLDDWGVPHRRVRLPAKADTLLIRTPVTRSKNMVTR